MHELLAGQRPKRSVLVAVIDGGVDTSHAALRSALARNPREVPGNQRDDDGNGYVDDVLGWNFLGASDGRNIEFQRFELTRVAARCRAGERVDVGIPCDSLLKVFDATRRAAAANLAWVDSFVVRLDSARALLARVAHIPVDSLTAARVATLPTGADSLEKARAIFLRVPVPGPIREVDAFVREQRASIERSVTIGYDLSTDPHAIVSAPAGGGRRYGNPNVNVIATAYHGTAVAGVIAGAPGDSGAVGIAPFAQVLMIRAAIAGDERDEDVANAIRYAVDRGAHVINMSFGKAYSPLKEAVDSAVQYAVSKGVLLVHSAGNDASDKDRVRAFPAPEYARGGRATTWIEVGASGSRTDSTLATSFSDYGQTRVDLFAPGDPIFVPKAGGGYSRDGGTSFAAPMVSGVAALLMAYFPSLTAVDVKRILLASVTSLRNTEVLLPGGGGRRVQFGALSVSGGVVNAYEAVRLAQQEAAR